MKQYSSLYPLLLGMIMIGLGIFYRQPTVALCLGGPFVGIAVFLIIMERRKKRSSGQMSEKQKESPPSPAKLKQPSPAQKEDRSAPGRTKKHSSYQSVPEDHTHRCKRCCAELSDSATNLCTDCSGVIETLQPQLDRIDTTVDQLLDNPEHLSEASRVDSGILKQKARHFLEDYIQHAEPVFFFYDSEYPMGAAHCKSFSKYQGIWYVRQYDYDKTPAETSYDCPQITDENIGEEFVRLLLKEGR